MDARTVGWTYQDESRPVLCAIDGKNAGRNVELLSPRDKSSIWNAPFLVLSKIKLEMISCSVQ